MAKPTLKRSASRNATLAKEKMRSSVNSGGANTASAAQPGKAPSQLELFEQAMRLFHARKLREARDLFERAREGPDRPVAHRAQLHAQMCEQRLEQIPLVFSTVEEHYNYAITQINTRNLDAALEHLHKALAGDGDADHVYYALAACYALRGEAQAAHDHLKRAIELQPKNRIAARQDADFAAMSSQPLFEELLVPEKNR